MKFFRISNKTQEKEDIINIKYSRKSVLTSLLLGVVCFSLFLFILAGDPILLALKYYTKVTNGSFVHNFMINEMEGVHLSATLFNISNAQEFINGTDDVLKVEQVGPFTYREIRSNVDVDIDEKAGVVRYTPKIRVEFVPEESVADPNEVFVTVPNLPMLGMTSKMSEYNLVTRYGFNQMTALLDSKPIITLDAYNYLWGYDEPLVSIGHKLIPGSVKFDKIGILDRLYATKNRIEASIAEDDKYMIKRVNGHEKLNMGESGNPDECELCNNFVNSYEGVGFKPGASEGYPIRLFKNGLCRTLDLEYNGTRPTDYGGTAFVYRFKDSFYVLEPEKNTSGVITLPDCFFGLPLAFSKPLFQDCDPALYERIEGVKPDPEKYPAWVAIDPRLGMALETKFSIQLNLVVKDVSTNAQAKSFSNMVLPICLIEIEQPPLPKESHMFLSGVYHLGPKILLAAEIILVIISIICWIYFTKAVYINHVAKDTSAMTFPIKTPIIEINGNNLETPISINAQKEKLNDDFIITN